MVRLLIRLDPIITIGLLSAVSFTGHQVDFPPGKPKYCWALTWGQELPLGLLRRVVVSRLCELVERETKCKPNKGKSNVSSARSE